MRVLHLSPTSFDDRSVIGGAERYSLELARACAAMAPTTLVTFADRTETQQDGALRVRRLRSRAARRGRLSANPLRPALLAEIRRADVVHCHQVDTFATSAAVIAGAALGKRVFVSDLGGGHLYAPSLKLPILPRATGLLLLSEYSRVLWQAEPAWRRPPRMAVIYGGVDLDRFRPSGAVTATQALFVGRLVRHKGVEHAIAAVTPPLRLVVAGRPYDQAYAAMLRDAAGARDVVFQEHVGDGELPLLYAGSLATIVPSVYHGWGGAETRVPELLGLVVLESMACGTPPIVSDVASLPELVEHGVTGFVVPPGDHAAIGAALRVLMADPARRAEMGRRARAVVEARFTWRAVAARCLEAYAS